MVAPPPSRAAPKAPESGVVLLAMGGPPTPQDVQPFLEELFNDREMIRLPRVLRPFQPRLARWIATRRSVEVGKKYAAIGGSPLVATTEALAEAVGTALAREGRHVITLAGMRYGPPRAPEQIRTTLGALAEMRPGAPVVLLPQYPFYSTATTASSLKEAEKAVRDLGLKPVPVLRFGDHPEHVALIVALTKEALHALPPDIRDDIHLLVSVHGLPERYVRDGDPYQDEVEACVAALRDRLHDDIPHARIHLSFQSRVGPVKWIDPPTDKTVIRLATEGVRHLLVLPLGFTCDHLETLEEIDLLYAGLAKRHGIHTFARVPTPGLDPRYVRLQADIVKRHLNGSPP